MDRDTIFLYVIAAIALCFGLINCIQFFLKGNKTAETVGTIISFKTINPENSKFRNSKWATVSYKVNGRTYQSQNCIQVPMASQIGTTVTVRYDTQNPEKLYSFSILRIIVSLIVALSALQRLYSILYKIRRIEIMPHFPDWFVAICVLLPVSNVIYKTWKNNKKK